MPSRSSPDPDLVEEVRDLVGLYMNPPTPSRCSRRSPPKAAPSAYRSSKELADDIIAWGHSNENHLFRWHKAAEQTLERLAGYWAAINEATTP